jgi:hypothetical protein
MTATQNFRTTTTGSTAAPTVPADGRNDTTTNQPRRVGPAIAAVVAVAAAAGILAVRSNDDSTATDAGAVAVAQPLVGAEEQAFIDARTTPLTHAAPTSATADPVWGELADVNARFDTLGTAVDPVWGQLADVNARFDTLGTAVDPVWGQLAEVNAVYDGVVGMAGDAGATAAAVDPLIVAEEQAFIDGRVAPSSVLVVDPVWEQLTEINAGYDAVVGTAGPSAISDHYTARRW